ncbi:uncharacterized protein Z518_07793 [Rhinocladiella mackenziei CBS 650.93]|uniref:C2H2-type domain-containing protein n=1 Tax=Rhinocladiella mackenziei CBS 650.93 TaxID=1442369 RepID=A0A0D2IEI6_9EURO|nr:uncharacterized protein Z518_07793 [Rhinocladiella mackenziei CBS 650.93]KIX04239.1 hypothetical protein Z518_07793 [Rhinocladiella mackenziei CBS 650.93]
MAVDTQDAIFSMTPPPSEFDEFDKGGLLTCSPSLPGFTYPSPAPSSRGHAPSVSSESIYILPGMPMSENQGHDGSGHGQHDLAQQISFGDTSSDSAVAAASSFFPPVSGDPSISMVQYTAGTTATNTSTTANSYAMYEQNQWFPYSSYPQPGSLLPYDPTSSASFSPFDSHHQPNIIPPTPQDIQPSHPFDFNAAPTAIIPSNHHLVASPSFSQVSHPSSHSHRGSVSSLSRSCSPISSLYRDNSRGHGDTLRSSVRSGSASSNTSLHAYGIPVTESPASAAGLGVPSSLATSTGSSVGGGAPQSWRCAYPGCTSRATFTRGCDLRKHYNRHSKHLFCRVDGCPQSEAAAAARAKSADQPLTGGFSSKKDRARHEAKHNPGIKCEWRGPEGEECGRVFSRMDNMKDHVRRIHNKGQNQNQTQNQSHSPHQQRK